MHSITTLMFAVLLLACAPMSWAQEASRADESQAQAEPAPPGFDAALAERVGADAHGMRAYVLVILKTGPKRVPDGDARKAMFAGHFANMERLSKEGKLALAGPFSQDPDGWRGLFVLATDDLDEARRLVATDPVIVNGEMVAEYHRWYGSAATMLVGEWHERIAREAP
jgi:uncharacterized protein YciI